MATKSSNLYKTGKVVSIGKTYIILESDYTGSIIYVARTKDFKKNWTGKVFIYEHDQGLYGFKTLEERNLFKQLLNIKKVGPKRAIKLLLEDVETNSILKNERR